MVVAEVREYFSFIPLNPSSAGSSVYVPLAPVYDYFRVRVSLSFIQCPLVDVDDLVIMSARVDELRTATGRKDRVSSTCGMLAGGFCLPLGYTCTSFSSAAIVVAARDGIVDGNTGGRGCASVWLHEGLA